LRARYRPARVRVLFVGEAPPASGAFFYQEDSGLYRAMAATFATAFPKMSDQRFLDSFRNMGCYLVDLCGRPVDRLAPADRRRARALGEKHLAVILEELRPRAIVVVVRAIEKHVVRAVQASAWRGSLVILPYPGRWHQHRARFNAELVPRLRTWRRTRLLAIPARERQRLLRP